MTMRISPRSLDLLIERPIFRLRLNGSPKLHATAQRPRLRSSDGSSAAHAILSGWVLSCVELHGNKGVVAHDSSHVDYPLVTKRALARSNVASETCLLFRSS